MREGGQEFLLEEKQNRRIIWKVSKKKITQHD
jgi:hypothetical protein